MSLNSICYENIKDNYYYGLFGDFKLVIDKSTGFFNATKLCNLGGKQYKHWYELKTSKSYINYLIKNFGSRDVDHQNRLERSKELVKILEIIRRGNSRAWEYEVNGNNNHEIYKQYTGYYVSKDLILDIASWISPEFYLKCNDIIINYYNNEFKNLNDKEIKNKINEIKNKYINIIDEKDEQLKYKDDKIDYLISQNNKIIESNKKLEEKSDNLENINKKLLKLAERQNIKLDEIEDELEETNYRLDNLQTVEETILPDRNIQPTDNNLKHNLVIYKTNDTIKIIRAQNKYINKNNIPNNDIIIKEYVPNPIDFINRIKLYCNDLNKKLKKERKNNRNLSYEDFIDLYDSDKKLEIKYNNIILNNSYLTDINIYLINLNKNNMNIEFL
ncbi:N1R/p28-like protein [Choristoneura rosaceana entomopoxvirus 'L']|uniref:N1R/p28-like protein n=1 Tax=Choristoneura rosaceana entomopoxvirus 'L' TaxID=1293539 RepID=A0ABM9QKX8_9POXV|nr:N1R/p28-like protein [Choristoneura rosaceana entomopoxvirus 'L']CCU56185.1 N1R/p28-like protein [Choristoneura rosaceana entomopoxvirus 'L']